MRTNKLKNFVKRGVRALGYDLTRLTELEKEIISVYRLGDPFDRHLAAERLTKNHPDAPAVHALRSMTAAKIGDTRTHEYISIYFTKRLEYLATHRLEEFTSEFIWQGMAIGSLGNLYALAGLIEANNLGLRKTRNIWMLKDQKAPYSNPTLFEYFKPFITVIEDQEINNNFAQLSKNIQLPLGVSLPFDNHCLFLDYGANYVNKHKSTSRKPFLKLKSNHQSDGLKILKKMGVPADAWYVTLHVREANFRGETIQNTTENFRNSAISDYKEACEAIADMGGWVLRMGNKGMSEIENFPNTYDYANSEFRSDWMDVFLAATCRFCIGTASGFFRVPQFFGVPVILTNSTQTIPYFSLTDKDIFLPRMLKKTSTDEPISIYSLMASPTNLVSSDDVFRKIGLSWINNTPEEITESVKQMMHAFKPNGFKHGNISENQQGFNTKISKLCSAELPVDIRVLGRISEHFFKKYY